jgi:hypothetical protein
MVSTALFQSGVAVRNNEITAQLQAGAQSFTVPFWADLGEQESDITNDDPTDHSTPLKITAARQVVLKSFLHQSWRRKRRNSFDKIFTENSGEFVLDYKTQEMLDITNK